MDFRRILSVEGVWEWDGANKEIVEKKNLLLCTLFFEDGVDFFGVLFLCLFVRWLVGWLVLMDGRIINYCWFLDLPRTQRGV